jgi:PAS domain S-box-containing protein
MWVYDLETHAFHEVNDAAIQKYGFSRKEFLARTIKDIRPSEDVTRLIDDVKHERFPLEGPSEWRHRLRNGTVIDVSITSHMIDYYRRQGVLVMDDEEFILEIAGKMLQEMGYTVVPAKDGEEAISLFTQAELSNTPFIASILDMTIPGSIGGEETATALRKLNPHAIIIASSGYSENPVIAYPTNHGFTDRIIKPYRKNELAELMMRVTKN